jgi:hypothetical protein
MADVGSGSNCEELTVSTHFRVTPKNRHGAVERKRLSLSAPPSRCELVVNRSISAFFEISRGLANRDRTLRAQERRRYRRLVETAGTLVHEILSGNILPYAPAAKAASFFAVRTP